METGCSFFVACACKATMVMSFWGKKAESIGIKVIIYSFVEANAQALTAESHECTGILFFFGA